MWIACLALGLSASALKAEVSFPTGTTAHIVVQPKTELERRVAERLAEYLGKVLGVPARVVPEITAVPLPAPAIVLASDGGGLSSELAVPTDSPEAFALETRTVDGRAVVVASGRTDRGLKRAMQRLVIKSEQRASGLVIPDLRVAEQPWMPRREWSPPMWSPELPGRREALHEEAKKRGLQMGVWGWHTAEIETDQNPNMHVNAKLLSHFYRQIRDGVHRIHPITYWSEMEAYHLNNIFTHYAAAQLLWNPDRDPDELLREIAEGIWGPRNGPHILAALQLIQDVRTGPTWDTYWIFLPNYRLGTTDARDDLRRADEAIARLGQMQTDRTFVPKFPLPFPPETFVELTLPHLRQIRHFADFRIVFAELGAAAKNGVAKEELTRRAQAAWNPVRDYGN